LSDPTDSDDPRARRPIAVALSYASDRPDAAPKVTASGQGAIAEAILEIAFARGVKVRQDADLAELLAAVDLDQEIPVEAFAAVAEVLAHVYRANGRAASGEAGGAGPSNEEVSS